MWKMLVLLCFRKNGYYLKITNNRFFFMPILSVIIPVYNAENTLRTCVDSILSQEFKDFELLLVDDGSKDLSPTICDDYARQDARVKVYHKENGGVSSARNLGLDKAKGKWISFVDSDDYVTGDFLEGISKAHEDFLLKEFCHLQKGEIVDNIIAEEINQYSSMRMFFCHCANHVLRGPCAKFYKKSLINGLRFRQEMTVGEDFDFVMRYLNKCDTFRCMPGGKYVIRVSEQQVQEKYGVTVAYAAQSLVFLQESFELLVQKWGVNRSVFYPSIAHFKLISKSDWTSDKSKWYSNPQIKSLYEYVWTDLSVKQKLRLMIARLLKR